VSGLELEPRTSRIQVHSLVTTQGRAVAEAVSRRLPTTVARVRSYGKSCGICGQRSGAGASFLRVHGLTLHRLFHTYHPSTAATSTDSLSP
jgi:hypothetical protein